ncbi:MAG TPA: hypothetical protein VEA81_01135 [Burkholderiaceae bacterium]|nr:hypothetical protein [Burkholderiaceae bacterium]
MRHHTVETSDRIEFGTSFQPASRRALRSSRTPLIAGALALALTACGGGGGPAATDTAATAVASAVMSAPESKPAPDAAAIAAAKTVNSVDQIVDDMKLMNDVPLAGIPSNYGFATGPGQIVMGSDPRGSATPSWWNPNDQRFKAGGWWNTLIPWLVIFDGEGNDAANTRVELGELKAWVKSRKSGQWTLVTKGPVEGWNYPKHLTGSDVSSPDYRTHGDNRRSVRPAGGNAVFHGWCCGKAAIQGNDVEAVHITVQARLVLHDASGPDDRAKAKYLVHVGGDYYPDASVSIEAFAPAVYNPGLGTSRAKLVRQDWTAISFTTIDVGKVEPTGRAMTESELRAAPPPIE